MSFQNFITNAVSEWMNGEGEDADIAISSRVRLARNIQEYPFPILATDSQLEQITAAVRQVMEDEDCKRQGPFEFIRMDQLTGLQKRVLMEKHLISPNLMAESRGGAVLLSENEAFSIMVNEEDHLRIQCLFSGLQLQKAWEAADRMDDIFEKHVNFAFDERRGYLTSCPTNVGTGIRASVMMHLPGLVLTHQINRILSAIAQVGLVVRGLYGEGSDASGNLFQISNQITLGQSEEEIIENLTSVAHQIIEQERAARRYLMQNRRLLLEDQLCRSYGVLTNARIIESDEAAEKLSDVRLGIDLGIIRNIPLSVMNELTVMVQPGFLQQHVGQQLDSDSRDERRARLIRERLQSAME
ncbi:protein arginine kinase [Aneurinibacillus soli]|uniref:Protein-arginine kinase n=1 Tax=Aneurinibacillus soli TaxID=1500254 RepID=A0A0U4WBC0_9BACL|nr:protein arginine kinase [Aneurinibacillus soli]PYE57679.1 protein arginine kinase [Aneurinibacillus soli]BAU26153.1 putative ATP:guanido phosphotransferase [Aneurinibacillus soli]